MGEKQTKRWEVRWSRAMTAPSAVKFSCQADAWIYCWKLRNDGATARVVRTVVRKRESAADAYKRGRREERDDVAAHVARCRPFLGHGLVSDIMNGVHLGAAKKGGA